MENERKLVIVVNDRTRMSRGKYAAQAVHAALLALGVHPDVPVVVLGGSASEIARMKTTVQDAGMTEVKPGTITAGTNWGAPDGWTPPEEPELDNLVSIISVRLPVGLADKLRGYAKAQEESVSDIVRGLISSLLLGDGREDVGSERGATSTE